MCGIFGVFYSDRAHDLMCKDLNRPRNVDPKVVPHEQLLALLAPPNLKRGNKAFGYFAWREDLRFARRWTQPFLADSITALPMKLVVVHNRAPTDGSADNISEVHPYSTKFGELFMNGILLNHLEFEERRHHDSKVDTAYLAGNLDYHLMSTEPLTPIEDAIANAVGELKGQQACVFVERKYGETFIWRNMATLFFGGHRRSGYSLVSSTRIPGMCDTEVPQGMVFAVDRNRCKLVPRAEFAYESIYEAKAAQS